MWSYKSDQAGIGTQCTVPAFRLRNLLALGCRPAARGWSWAIALTRRRRRLRTLRRLVYGRLRRDGCKGASLHVSQLTPDVASTVTPDVEASPTNLGLACHVPKPVDGLVIVSDSSSELSETVAAEASGVVRTYYIGKGAVQLTTEDIDRVACGRWLNDNVITCYLHLVQERNDRRQGPRRRRPPPPRSFMLSTAFYSQLTGRGYDYRAVQRWTNPVRTGIGQHVLSRDLILIPINLHQCHWTLAALRPRLGQLQYFDSLHGDGATVLRHCSRWYADEVRDKGLTSLPTVLHTSQGGMDIAKQVDSASCGVYVCEVAKRLASGRPPYFFFSPAAIERLRRRMVDSLVRGTLNTSKAHIGWGLAVNGVL